MQKKILLSLNKYLPDEDYDNIKVLNSLLKNLNATAELVADEQSNFLKIDYDSDKVRYKVKRNAGRKKEHFKHLDNITYGQLKTMLTEDTQDNVAYHLEISRSTLCRLLKRCRTLQLDDNVLVQDYH